MFSVASERASGVPIVRFDIERSDERVASRTFLLATRILKRMKERGAVQFFATPKSFIEGEREASFLINKFPELFSNFVANEDDIFIYVRI
jgi:hypothetical protein